MDDPSTPASRTVVTDAELPLRARWHFGDPGTGRVLEVDVILDSVDGWGLLPQSREPGWRPLRHGGLMIGVRVFG